MVVSDIPSSGDRFPNKESKRTCKMRCKMAGTEMCGLIAEMTDCARALMKSVRSGWLGPNWRCLASTESSNGNQSRCEGSNESMSPLHKALASTATHLSLALSVHARAVLLTKADSFFEGALHLRQTRHVGTLFGRKNRSKSHVKKLEDRKKSLKIDHLSLGLIVLLDKSR